MGYDYNPSWCKFIKDKVKNEDKHVSFEIGSNQDEKYSSSWKPGETMMAPSGKWASRVENLGAIGWEDGAGSI